jgi:hypothetical protein
MLIIFRNYIPTSVIVESFEGGGYDMSEYGERWTVTASRSCHEDVCTISKRDSGSSI